MSIQFTCPHCSALIRVPDSAAGKTGTCPQCQAQLLVPQVDIPVFDLQPTTHSVRPIEQSAMDSEQPTLPMLAPMPVPKLETTSTDPTTGNTPAPLISTTQPSVVKRFTRRKRNRWRILLPISCSCTLIAAITYFYLHQGPILAGTLSAKELDTLEVESVLIAKNSIGFTDEIVDLVLESLADAPLQINTGIIQTELRGTSKGLAVNLRQGNQTRFYRLSIQSLPDLLKYYDQHSTELTELKHRELGDALEELFGNWETHLKQGRSESTLLKLRNQIGLNAVVGGLGYHLVAVVGNAHIAAFTNAIAAFTSCSPQTRSNSNLSAGN